MISKDDVRTRNNNTLIEILSTYVREKKFPFDQQRASQIDFNYISNIAMDQGLGSMLYKAVENVDFIDPKVKNKLSYYYEKSLLACASRCDALSRISNLFEREGIDFFVLKGAVIQSFYPSPELRVMSDVDFLIKIDDREKVKSLLSELEIVFVKSNSYQDIYKTSNGIIIEIHHALWGYDLEETSLYKNLWNSSNLVSGKKHTYLLSYNDLYIFTIAHIKKHFIDSGIGIRPVFDIWYIFKKTISLLDFNYIKKELVKFNADKFEKKIREIVNCVFLDKEKTDDSLIILDYMLRCNTHGTSEISNANNHIDKSKIGFLFYKLFPPLAYMKRRFPFLEKMPFLLPIYWIYRFILLPFQKGSTSRNVKKITNTDKSYEEYVKSVFAAAGISKENQLSKARRNNLLISLILILFLIISFCLIYFRNDYIGIITNNSDYNSDYVASSTSSIDASEFVSDEISSDISDSDYEYGTISWKGGRYTGYLIHNIPNGSGEHIVENAFRYVGYFVNGSYDGKGKIEYSDGSFYEGSFENNQANGEGTLYCANGDIINGTFTEGQPGGFCNYQYSDGNLFEGTMVKGLKHGEGTFYWLNGDKYVGSFIDDLRDGYGVLYYSNGDVYTGSWSQGFCNGYGTYTWSTGRKYEGNFEIGMMNDTDCTIYYPDGSEFKGEISDGIQNGSGQLTYANGDIAKGKFLNGFLSGEADYYFKEKKLWVKVVYEKGEIIKYILK